MNSSKELLSSLNFTVIDLETTGGNQNKDKIIEIGIVKISNLKISTKISYFIQPNIDVPDFIQKLTSISPSDLKEAPILEEKIDEIIDFIGDSILVAHNTSFDIPFLNSELRRMGRAPLTNKSICTNLMTKYLIPNLLNSNLTYMSKIFGLKHKKAHRALDDAQASAELLLTFLDIFIKKEIKKINHLYYPRNKYELDRFNIKNEGQDISKAFKKIKTPSVITLKGLNGIILFAFPSINSEQDIIFIKEQISNLEWINLTVRLFGSFLESFLYFSTFYQKIGSEIKNQTLNFLWNEHIKKNTRNAISSSNLTTVQDTINQNNKLSHFIIVPHLVPEQMVIYPTQILENKQSLIFRYPGHKKKLIQYTKSKLSRLSTNKRPRVNLSPSLLQFITTYIKELSEKNDKTILSVDKRLVTDFQEEFFTQLDHFISLNTTDYNFPKDYI